MSDDLIYGEPSDHYIPTADDWAEYGEWCSEQQDYDGMYPVQHSPAMQVLVDAAALADEIFDYVELEAFVRERSETC